MHYKKSAMWKYLFFFFGISALLPSCKHELPEVVDDSAPCVPGVVYFKNDVLPILQSNCAMSGCHDAGSAQDGVQLTDYANVMRAGVEAGKSGSSDLYEVLVDNDPKDIMPPPPAKLTADQIKTIKNWIDQGAKNNACSSCDSSGTVSFSNKIWPMINSGCVGCHGYGKNTQLADYSSIKTQVDNGKLSGALNHKSGFLPMPQGGSKWSDCQLRMLERWIADGAPNN